ncbi:MAG: hypothetical protein ACK56I_24775, partial [bacterium]
SGGALSRRPLLATQCHPPAHPTAARTSIRHPLARRALPQQDRRQIGAATAQRHARDTGDPHGLSVARECP